MSKNKDLYIFIKDDDARTFAVAGPIEHDSVNEWFDQQSIAKAQGRQVSVFDHFEEYLLIAVKGAFENKFKRVTADEIIKPPKDRSAEYHGSLPLYAKDADRERLVKLFCKGKCMKSTWAELNTVFPGEQNLRNASHGMYSAKCLRCGSIASDHYNWGR